MARGGLDYSLWVSIDTEFVSPEGERGEARTREHRRVVSWQCCFTVGGRLVEWMLLPRTAQPPHIDEFCALVAERAGAPVGYYGREHNPTFNMTLVAHSQQADITTFKGSKRVLQILCSAAGGLFTGRSAWNVHIKRRRIVPDASTSQLYQLRVAVRDTMNFSAAGTSLAVLGDAVGLPKLDMSEDDYRDMAQVRDAEFERFAAYSIRDVEVAHRYLASAFGLVNVKLKPTIPSLSATYLRRRCTQALDGLGFPETYRDVESQKTDAYDAFYRGVRRKRKGLVAMHGVDGSREFVVDERLIPVTEVARDTQSLAAFSFKGGWNGCNVVGYFEGETYDADLCGAYPTASGAVLDPDWFQPFARTWEDEGMALQQLPPWSAFRPGFGCVHFEFPEAVKYPCLGFQTEHGIVYPRTSEGTSGCYVTLPEVVLALRLGARVHALRFVIPAVHERDDVLLAAYKGLIEQRARDAVTYGKKSPQELGDKLMNNAGLGKHGQDVSPKTYRDLRSLEMKDRGTSEVTNPVVASMSTALPRVCLLAAANQLDELGYRVFSETTDGFISDAPADVLTALDLYGFADRMRYVRAYYSDGADDKIWEIKHVQRRLLNQTTRLNVGFEPGGVLARGGFKGYKRLPGEKDVSGERRERFVHDVVTRTSPLAYTSRDWVSPADMLDWDEDMHVYKGRHAANPNFDMKRRPLLDTMADVEFACAGDVVRVANYDTAPWETLGEFRRHKATVGEHQLVLAADYVKAAERAANYTGRELTDTDFVRWAVTAHRSGRVRIDALSDLSGAERLRFINAFIHDGRPFTPNDWKNAGRQSRQNLPEPAVWMPWVEDMEEAWVGSLCPCA
ncbi:hypothetical protein [Thermophilibacter provencensis]|uniref:DNA-directed DNA polymerase n=1 Tax=Thermophilibacter provencensis TaxID=1852386 RepID=A0A921GHF5_9ACTN|nr:hypothetical protein [Thermophilibacter provencensis]HJF46143.1 hypothetical protein [Thermophilibacter provencensis]